MNRSRALVCLLALGVSIVSTPGAAQPVELLSRPEDPQFFGRFGNQNSGTSNGCWFSDDGSRLLFPTTAYNLFPDDRNANFDVVVHELGTQALRHVSVNSAGIQADGINLRPSISGNGRYAMFESNAPNLGVTGSQQAFRHDLDTGETVPVGFAPDGSEFSSVFPGDLSGDGRLAVFTADDQAWLRDIDLGVTTLLSVGTDGQPADSFVSRPQVSALGDVVTFDSPASNLVNGDSNGERDIFILDPGTTSITRIEGIGGSEPDGESERAQLSSDGRWIAFESAATNLVPGDVEGQYDVFLHDRQTGTTIRVSADTFGSGGNAISSRPAISADGRFVVFQSEANNLVSGLSGIERRLFLYDRQFDTLRQVASAASFPQSPCVSNSGNSGWIAYLATEHPLIPSNLRHNQVVLEPFESTDPDRGVNGGLTSAIISSREPALPVPIGNGASLDPAIASGGGFIAFRSSAGNLLGQSPNGTQIVRLDTSVGDIVIASLGFDGAPVEGGFLAEQASISASGNRVAFTSRSPGLVPDDNNETEDVFVRDLSLGQIRRVSVDSGGNEGNANSRNAVLSADGSVVAFWSEASNLVSDDTNGEPDIFLHRLTSGETERVSVTSAGAEADDESKDPDISANGRFVVFASRANLLDCGGPITTQQIWLRDRQLELTTRVSSAPGGEAGNGTSTWPVISANGRWIAYRSSSTNLDPAFPTLPGEAIFLLDRQSGITQLVSLDADEQPVPVSLDAGPQLASDGRALLFQRFTNSGGGNNRGPAVRGNDPEGTLYVRDLAQQRTVRIDPRTQDGLPPNAPLLPAAIEPGGRIVYVVSEASNLVSGMLNGDQDIYRIDLDRVFDDGFEAAAP